MCRHTQRISPACCSGYISSYSHAFTSVLLSLSAARMHSPACCSAYVSRYSHACTSMLLSLAAAHMHSTVSCSDHFSSCSHAFSQSHSQCIQSSQSKANKCAECILHTLILLNVTCCAQPSSVHNGQYPMHRACLWAVTAKPSCNLCYPTQHAFPWFVLSMMSVCVCVQVDVAVWHKAGQDKR